MGTHLKHTNRLSCAVTLSADSNNCWSLADRLLSSSLLINTGAIELAESDCLSSSEEVLSSVGELASVVGRLLLSTR